MSSKNLEKKILKKQIRCQNIISNETQITFSNQPTQNIVICNAGLSTGLLLENVLEEFKKYGSINEVIMIPGKSYCFLKCLTEKCAENMYNELHGKTSKLAQNDGILYLSYSEDVIKVNNPWQKELPPGLILLENFCTILEEKELLNFIKETDEKAVDSNELQNKIPEQSNGNNLKNRIVKHYGYQFLYDTNNIDTEKPLKQKIPPMCDKFWLKLSKELPTELCPIQPNQLTVNIYEPGQGIPPHCDTHSAFLDPILSLSLGTSVVMEFRNITGEHVNILLPQRSLLIISGESRYGWTHGITPRKMDVIYKTGLGLSILKRTDIRVSFTFRTLKSTPCNCEFLHYCDSYKLQEEKRKQTELKPSTLELNNVHEVYDKISNHFSETRHSPWPRVEDFINSFDKSSILLDIGCGNGKYLSLNNDIFKIGCDRSGGLLNVCKERKLNIFKCDCLYLPVRSNSIDGCISIAVIHHLASAERRLQAILEMARVLRSGGKALIYVWSKNQEKDKKQSSYLRQNKKNNKTKLSTGDDDEDVEFINGLPVHKNRTQFVYQDMLVPWKLKIENNSDGKTTNDLSGVSNVLTAPETFLRYYHVFDENELEEMCAKISCIQVETSYYDQGNWCVIFRKI